MKKWIIVLIVLVLPAAASAMGAKGTGHMPSGDQDCSECHPGQSQAWLNGKHGVLNVKCVICHGSPETNFVPKPEAVRCRACHNEQFEQAAKKKAKAGKNCFSCHDRHSLRVKAGTRTPFHAEGGR